MKIHDRQAGTEAAKTDQTPSVAHEQTEAVSRHTIAARLLSDPWRVAAPWKSWPARSQSPADLHWKEQIDACADRARQEVLDHLVSLCGTHLRLSATVMLQPGAASPLPCTATARSRAVELHRVDLVGRFEGMVHAQAHVAALLKACQSSTGKEELLRQCVRAPSPELSSRWYGIDHIEACDVAGRLVDVCIVWSRHHHSWTGDASDGTRHIALAGEFLSYASALRGSLEEPMQGRIRQASRHLDLAAKMAALTGNARVLVR